MSNQIEAFEGWRPGRGARAVAASLSVVARYVDVGTSTKLMESLPKELRVLWPAYVCRARLCARVEASR